MSITNAIRKIKSYAKMSLSPKKDFVVVHLMGHQTIYGQRLNHPQSGMFVLKQPYKIGTDIYYRTYEVNYTSVHNIETCTLKDINMRMDHDHQFDSEQWPVASNEYIMNVRLEKRKENYIEEFKRIHLHSILGLIKRKDHEDITIEDLHQACKGLPF